MKDSIISIGEVLKKGGSFIWTAKWKILSVLFMLFTPIVSYIMMEEFVHGIDELNSTEILYFNILFVYIVEIFFFFITFSSRWACAVPVLMCGIVGAVYYAVYSFRSLPIMPWDLLSFGTAMSVVGEYKFEFTPKIIKLIVGFCLLLLAVLLLCRSRIKMKNHFRIKLAIRVVCLVLCVPMLMGYAKKAQDEEFQSSVGYYPYLFTPSVVYRDNGFYFSFISLLKYLDVSEPHGYSVEKIQAVADSVGNKNTTSEADVVNPNIIVVMNESFSDLSVLGDFEVDGEYMPFIDSLTENTIKGQAYVSVKGGNTPNSEWEFLTGNSMAFLPAGSIPYQQYIRGETENFITSLKEKGYSTYAVHPYNASGWKRDEVYPLLGFDTSFFRSSHGKLDMIRGYVSDEAVYDKIIRIYNDNLTNDDPLAFFCVTMQNHGGYSNVLDYDNFDISLHVSNVRNATAISGYLSLVKISDEAFGNLVEYFSGVDEPTIILMYGDHQPNSSITKYILEANGIDENTEDWNVRKDQFAVPFVLWANYDIEEQTDITTSLNYLNILLSETAGFELSGYQLFRKQLSDKYPVITANFCINDRGELYTWKDLDVDKDEDLLLYKQLQYNHTFDTDNTIEDFFD
ncbi:MAG: LTA synthase family protein [Clostridia bacterium]|nr:LTA synthase family protein [Clostridia bacterium]